MMTITTRANRSPRSAVVVNPAKVEDAGALRRTVDDALVGAGWPVPRWFETTPADPGAGQTHAAVESGAEVIFVCGGDGTVMSAVSAMVGVDASMAILPAGTGNLLAANLGLSTDLATALEVAVEGGLRRLDVGVVDGQHFAVMAGMGFDAHMLEATSDRAKARIGWPAYVLGAVRHLKDRPMRVTIRIDDEAPIRRRARSVLIANVGRLQGGVRLLRKPRPTTVSSTSRCSRRELCASGPRSAGACSAATAEPRRWRSSKVPGSRSSATGHSHASSTATSSRPPPRCPSR
ncbi:diacylglycerol/lipid kinase family protein [Dactylosporangium cerinum]